jgi:hypothetical protein
MEVEPKFKFRNMRLDSICLGSFGVCVWGMEEAYFEAPIGISQMKVYWCRSKGTRFSVFGLSMAFRRGTVLSMKWEHQVK